MFHILISDSSREILNTLKLLLEMEGYSIKTALNRSCLFNELNLSAPNLIIIDTNINGEDGKEICKEIRGNSHTKNIPVILISLNHELLENYQNCGANDFLLKPFDISALIKKIDNFLN